MKVGVLFWVLLCLGLVAFIIDPLVARQAASIRHPLIDTAEELLTVYLTPVVVLVLFGIFLFFHQRKEMIAYLVAALSSALVAVVLKASTMRTRPFEALGLSRLNNVSVYAFDAWNSSFPSWHAAAVFVILPFVPEKYQRWWLVFAIVYALVRVSAGVHYLSDILIGAAMGVGIGLVCKKYAKQLQIPTHA